MSGCNFDMCGACFKLAAAPAEAPCIPCTVTPSANGEFVPPPPPPPAPAPPPEPVPARPPVILPYHGYFILRFQYDCCRP